MAENKINKKIEKGKIVKAVKKEEEAVESIVKKEIEEGREMLGETEKEIVEKINEESEDLEEEKEEIKEKTEKKKTKVEKGKPKKTEAVVNGRDLSISTKHSVAICNFIRGRDIDIAIGLLEEVAKMKRAVPMKGEIPHRRGKGMMSGRYPVKAALEFIKLLKSLKANAIANELELEKVRISCKANIASRPYKRFGQGRFKRSHVEIKLVPFAVKLKKSEDGDSVSTDRHANKKPSPKNQELMVNSKINEEDEE